MLCLGEWGREHRYASLWGVRTRYDRYKCVQCSRVAGRLVNDLYQLSINSCFVPVHILQQKEWHAAGQYMKV